MQERLHVVSAVPLLWFPGLMILGNGSIVARWLTVRRRASLVLRVGGVLGSVGMVCARWLRRWCWVPPVVDPGTLGLLVAALARRTRRTPSVPGA